MYSFSVALADRVFTFRIWATTIVSFMPWRGIEPQWNDQRITDYPTAPQRRFLRPFSARAFNSTRAMFILFWHIAFFSARRFISFHMSREDNPSAIAGFQGVLPFLHYGNDLLNECNYEVRSCTNQNKKGSSPVFAFPLDILLI